MDPETTPEPMTESTAVLLEPLPMHAYTADVLAMLDRARDLLAWLPGGAEVRGVWVTRYAWSTGSASLSIELAPDTFRLLFAGQEASYSEPYPGADRIYVTVKQGDVTWRTELPRAKPSAPAAGKLTVPADDTPVSI